LVGDGFVEGELVEAGCGVGDDELVLAAVV